MIPKVENVTDKRYKLCPSCGNFAEFSDKQVYCTICGEGLIAECQKCHEPILYPTARFCSVCGNGLRTLQAKNNNESSNQ